MSDATKSGAEISAEMRLFSIRDFSVLVDDSTDPAMIEAIPRTGVEGYYTFTAAMAGRSLGGGNVQLLPALAAAPSSKAWLVATRSKAPYALNEYLRQHRRDDSIVLTLAKDHVSPMYSYVDFFHGETATKVYVTNTFERGYKIHFPIAVRFLLRSRTGEVRRCGQRLIAPNQTIVFDSGDMRLAAPFVGYLEIYADIRHLNGEVTPFLHFNCDYVSDDAVTTIHQSGFKPWPAGSRFVRGLVPTDGRSELTVSVLSKTSETPVVCRAELRFTRNGQCLTAERDLPPVAKDEMLFVNINRLFADVLTAGAEAADVVIVPDQPLHRPNFYLHRRGRPWCWSAVEHGAALTEHILTTDQRSQLDDLGVRPWICAFPILDDRFGIDTSVHYFQEGAARLHDFSFEIHDHAGTRLGSEEVRCGPGQRLNVTEWARQRSLGPGGGLLKVFPGKKAQQVPHSFSFLEGFQSRRNPDFSLVVCGGGMLNIPFEWERGWMWNHPMVPTVHTEQFGKAVVDDAFDTLVTLINASASMDYAAAAELDFDVYAADGQMAHFRKVIPPNSTITFSVGELLQRSDLPKQGHYALWVYCRDRSIQGFHILQRRTDGAIGAQHFYYCRFNTLERDLPIEIDAARPQQIEIAAIPPPHPPASRAKRLAQAFGLTGYRRGRPAGNDKAARMRG